MNCYSKDVKVEIDRSTFGSYVNFFRVMCFVVSIFQFIITVVVQLVSSRHPALFDYPCK